VADVICVAAREYQEKQYLKYFMLLKAFYAMLKVFFKHTLSVSLVDILFFHSITSKQSVPWYVLSDWRFNQITKHLHKITLNQKTSTNRVQRVVKVIDMQYRYQKRLSFQLNKNNVSKKGSALL